VREAKLFITPADGNPVRRKVQVMAALHGGVILTGDILDSGHGVRTQYRRALSSPVAVHLTREFQAAEQGLTMMLADAFAAGEGWREATVAQLKGQDRACHCLFLMAAEGQQRSAGKGAKVKCFTGEQFVTWLADRFLAADGTSRVKADLVV
jgi:hypothetical protein